MRGTVQGAPQVQNARNRPARQRLQLRKLFDVGRPAAVERVGVQIHGPGKLQSVAPVPHGTSRYLEKLARGQTHQKVEPALTLQQRSQFRPQKFSCSPVPALQSEGDLFTRLQQQRGMDFPEPFDFPLERSFPVGDGSLALQVQLHRSHLGKVQQLRRQSAGGLLEIAPHPELLGVSLEHLGIQPHCRAAMLLLV